MKYRRYDKLIKNNEFIYIPTITISTRKTDKTIVWDRNVHLNTPNLSYQFYGSPYFGDIIKMANAQFGVDEWEWKNGTIIRIPYPINPVIQEYNQKKSQAVEKRKRFINGQLNSTVK